MRKKFLVFCCAAALAVSAAGCSPAEKAPAQETQTEQQTEAPETEESSHPCRWYVPVPCISVSVDGRELLWYR